VDTRRVTTTQPACVQRGAQQDGLFSRLLRPPPRIRACHECGAPVVQFPLTDDLEAVDSVCVVRAPHLPDSQREIRRVWGAVSARDLNRGGCCGG
jgi:hypothetical protein